jgi:uncharacterized cupin superfamily protein
MSMDEILKVRLNDVQPQHKNEHDGYEYYKRELIPKGKAQQCAIIKGAHKLTNISGKDMLVYLDFDTNNDIDVAFYPDSGKVGIWGKYINQLFKINQQVGYYDGE